MQGCGAFISFVDPSFNHSIKIGHIPIHIGIKVCLMKLNL